MDLEKSIEAINKNRAEVEASFVFCLWKNPDLYSDYKFVNEKEDNIIKSEDAVFYFNLGRALYQAGYQKFDNITIHNFLQDKKTIKKKFDEFGGYKTVEDLRGLVSIDNVEAYYDKIAKINTLEHLCKTSFSSL